MQYTLELEIDLPLSIVTGLFDNPENLKLWMEGLVGFEHLSGTPGESGAKSKLTFKMGNRNIEMIETITVRNLPEEFTGTYEANCVYNVVRNKFEALPGNRTRYIVENFFEVKGFMKAVAFFMPGAFKKQSLKYMEDFKYFAENYSTDLNNSIKNININNINTVQPNGTH